jgi:hypothetical protein
MATRSAIVMHDGTHQNYFGIYCHWDGYPEYNGMILIEHYLDINKVKELISLGDLSSLGDEIGEKHAFNNRDEKYCTFYGRDRGEPGTNAKPFASLEDVINYYRPAVDYVYVYHPNDYEDWTCYDTSSGTYINLYKVREAQEKENA